MECSGRVRDALRARGYDAWSCDVQPCESDPRWHIHGNVFSHEVVNGGWDAMIAHPDCTFLTVAGARWMSTPWRAEAMQMALYAVRALWAFPIRRKAIENPIGRLSTLWRKPSQIIQPWQFGHGAVKATCLWLDGLPPLVPTNIVEGRTPECHYESPGPDRARNRARTYQGIADAIADQWGAYETDARDSADIRLGQGEVDGSPRTRLALGQRIYGHARPGDGESNGTARVSPQEATRAPIQDRLSPQS